MENATKIIRKRKSWADDGEVAILDVWAERVSDLRGARKNGHVYKEMSAELNKLGYNYNARDIQVKLAIFTQRYRKEKMAMGPPGGSPSTWPFYGTVHQIIGGFKINVFNQLAFESIDESDNISAVGTPLAPIELSSPSPLPTPSPLPSSSPSPSPNISDPAKKENRSDSNKKVIEKLDQLSEEITKYMKKSEENEHGIITFSAFKWPKAFSTTLRHFDSL
ncbi:uncharacterized protein LOC105219800 [Zeugodacus cucurbitae]|uniref:uncharacterized protein LOC105219800 n=1 Tax=Zeugodacus cucurbitae TaxID=28588 RepID=UPI000596ABBB|nr:uncharacterized protein LOC105219800 [Zeugodacus cucurbitae]